MIATWAVTILAGVFVATFLIGLVLSIAEMM